MEKIEEFSLISEFELKTIGAFLAKVRKSKRQTQTDMANQLGLHRRTISRIELGDSDASIKTMKKYAESLGCKMIVEITCE